MNIISIFELSAAVLASLGGAGLIIMGFSSWLGKVWANRLMESERHENQKKLAEVTEKIRNENNIEIEKIKSSLNSSLIAESTRYEYLHNKRADALIELYQLIEDVKRNAFFAITLTKLEKKGNWKAYSDSSSKLSNYFNQNKLLFEKNLAEQIDNFVYSIRKPYISKTYIIDRKDDHLKDEAIQNMIEAWENNQHSLKETQKEIEKAFRKLLGVG